MSDIEKKRRRLRQALKVCNRSKKRFKQVMNELGLEVSVTGGDHFKVTSMTSGEFVYLANTPSDRRAAMNEESMLKRMLR